MGAPSNVRVAPLASDICLLVWLFLCLLPASCLRPILDTMMKLLSATPACTALFGLGTGLFNQMYVDNVYLVTA